MKWKDVRAKVIGEPFTPIQGKGMNFVAGDDVKNACNVDQLSSGAKASAEAVVHSMKMLFDENSSLEGGIC